MVFYLQIFRYRRVWVYPSFFLADDSKLSITFSLKNITNSKTFIDEYSITYNILYVVSFLFFGFFIHTDILLIFYNYSFVV